MEVARSSLCTYSWWPRTKVAVTSHPFRGPLLGSKRVMGVETPTSAFPIYPLGLSLLPESKSSADFIFLFFPTTMTITSPIASFANRPTAELSIHSISFCHRCSSVLFRTLYL